MPEVQLTPKQVVTIAVWSCSSADATAVGLDFDGPAFLDGWEAGDVLATQGDAHLHLSASGTIKEAVPPIAQR